MEYKQNFETLGANVVLYNIEENNFIHDLNNFDYVGIAYPIHAFNAPSNVLDFCKMLKKSQWKEETVYYKDFRRAIGIK